MSEQRAATRRRTFKAGTIEFGGGAIDCLVRNISETGAQLEVISPLYVPNRFTLYIVSDELKQPCRVVWKREKRLGVRFG
jgi:hypothetical protein